MDPTALQSEEGRREERKAIEKRWEEEGEG
jgi:hypothetical protein